MAEPSPFTLKVIAVIKKIPRGRVATYGQVAKLAGSPHASRAVVWILHSCTKKFKLPWHRVIKSNGKIAFPPHSLDFQKQAWRLSAEGVRVDELSGKIEMLRFQYKKKATVL